jgi:hypothetical protein
MLNVSDQMRVNDKRDVGIAERFQVIDIVDDVTLQSWYGEQKIAQFRTNYLTKEVAYVSTQQSGQVTMDTQMI